MRSWNCATIQQVSILKFAFAPQKLSGFSRNGSLARKILHFVSLTDSSILHVNNSFTGPLLNGTFEKRASGIQRKKYRKCGSPKVCKCPGGMVTGQIRSPTGTICSKNTAAETTTKISWAYCRFAELRQIISRPPNIANCILEGNSGKSQYRSLFQLFCMKENSVHHSRLIGSSTNGLCACKRYYEFQTAI